MSEKSIAILIDVVKHLAYQLQTATGVDYGYCKDRIDYCTKLLLDSVENEKDRIMEMKFKPLQRVLIPGIDNHPGTVTEVKWNGFFMLYGVEYWMDGGCKNVWVMDYELTEAAK